MRMAMLTDVLVRLYTCHCIDTDASMRFCLVICMVIFVHMRSKQAKSVDAVCKHLCMVHRCTMHDNGNHHHNLHRLTMNKLGQFISSCTIVIPAYLIS